MEPQEYQSRDCLLNKNPLNNVLLYYNSKLVSFVKT